MEQRLPQEIEFSERELNQAEVDRFRDEVVWPAINYLTRRDFVKDSLPGERYNWHINIGREEKPLWVTMRAGSTKEKTQRFGWTHIEQVSNVSISIDQEKPDLTDGMIGGLLEKAYKSDEFEVQVLEEDEDDSESESYEAFESRGFIFSTRADGSFSASMDYELQTSEGAVIDIGDEEDKSTDSDAPVDLDGILQLQNDIGRGLTAIDCFDIYSAFIGLGIPEEVFTPPERPQLRVAG